MVEFMNLKQEDISVADINWLQLAMKFDGCSEALFANWVNTIMNSQVKALILQINDKIVWCFIPHYVFD